MSKSAQSVMLALVCKRADTADLKAPLLAYVRATYSDTIADDSAEDLSNINALRTEVTSAIAAGGPSQRDALAKYLRALSAIETRFPVGREKGQAALSFSWYDAFQPKKKSTQTNIHFEKAAALFNLAAVISQMALACDRTSGEGLKQACGMFQVCHVGPHGCMGPVWKVLGMFQTQQHTFVKLNVSEGPLTGLTWSPAWPPSECGFKP